MAKGKLCRSSNGKIMGVCQGIANWLDMDVSLVRLAFIIGSFLTGGFLVFVYIALGIFLPVDDMGSETIFDKFKNEYTCNGSKRGSSGRKFTVDDIKGEYDSLKERVNNMESKVFDKEKDWDNRFKNS